MIYFLCLLYGLKYIYIYRSLTWKMSVYISYSMLIALGFVCILLCTPRRCLTLASCIVGSPIKLQISSFLHAMQEYWITSFKTYFFPTDKFVFSVHFLLCYFHVIVVAPLRLYIMCMYVYITEWRFLHKRRDAENAISKRMERWERTIQCRVHEEGASRDELGRH